jgi:ribosomal protein L13
MVHCDASDKILERLASTISIFIRGKNLATYTPSVGMGEFVIVVCSLHTNAYFSLHDDSEAYVLYDINF